MLFKKVCYELALIRNQSFSEMIGRENYYHFWSSWRIKDPVSIYQHQISSLRIMAKCLDVTPEFIVRLLRLGFIGGKENGNNGQNKRRAY